MKAPELSQNYAAAIFSLALEKWLVALNAVQNELARNSALLESLQSSARPFSDKQKDLDRFIPANSSQEIRNFLYTLLRNNDINLLGEVITTLERMIRGGGPRTQVARVTTATPLSESDQDEFQQKLRRQYGESLEFDFVVDPAIIGGAIVQIGDRVMDGSVATRLEAMSNTLGIKS